MAELEKEKSEIEQDAEILDKNCITIKEQVCETITSFNLIIKSLFVLNPIIYTIIIKATKIAFIGSLVSPLFFYFDKTLVKIDIMYH